MSNRIKSKQIKDFDSEVEGVAQNITTYQSAGVIYPSPIATKNIDGTVNVTSCFVSIRLDINHATKLQTYPVAAATNLVLTDNEVNYIVVNSALGLSGIPPSFSFTVLAEAELPLIEESSIIPIFTCFRTGTNVSMISWDSLGSGLLNKLHARLVKTNRYARESGFEITERATRVLDVVEGVIWYGGVRIDLPAFSSDTNVFVFWKKVAGIWTPDLTTTQYNNLQYQGATDLVSLTTDYYTVNWIYRCVDEASNKIINILADDEYASIAEAENSQEPVDNPGGVNINAFLIGRIIVKKGETNGLIQSAFYSFFRARLSSEHTNLAGLNADDHTQYALLAGRVGDVLNIDTISEKTTGTGVTFSQKLKVTEKINVGDEAGTPGDQAAGDIIWNGVNFKGYTGTRYKLLDLDKDTTTLQTTGSTPTVIKTITEIENSTCRFIKIYLTAFNTGDETEYVSWVRTLTVLKNSSGILSIPDVNADVDASNGLVGVTATFTVSGGNVVITVTGKATTTINWKFNYELI